jgi:hypothetical protein
LKIEKLKAEVEEQIIKTVLKKDNATYFYLESIKVILVRKLLIANSYQFKADKLSKAAENLIVLHFGELSESEKGA